MPTPLEKIKAFARNICEAKDITAFLRSEQNETIPLKRNVNYSIYPQRLFEEFYQEKVFSKNVPIVPDKASYTVGEQNKWSARFVVTEEGEIRFEREGTSISSAEVAWHKHMAFNSPKDILLADEAHKEEKKTGYRPHASYPLVLAAGKIYFAPGRDKPQIIAIDANSGGYKPHYESVSPTKLIPDKSDDENLSPATGQPALRDLGFIAPDLAGFE